jgi:hypothetical protein
MSEILIISLTSPGIGFLCTFVPSIVPVCRDEKLYLILMKISVFWCLKMIVLVTLFNSNPKPYRKTHITPQKEYSS